MIPKHIFDEGQTRLEDNPSNAIDRLWIHRKTLYNNFYGQMQMLNQQKLALTKSYLASIKEVEQEILKQEYKLQSLNGENKKQKQGEKQK